MSISENNSDLIIVGAGLCGLGLASMLCDQGRAVRVFEARSRVGGRIESCSGDSSDSGDSGQKNAYDMGPAWIWPHNRRMLALSERLGMDLMPQYATGRLVFEGADGQVRRDLDFATMGNALRIPGGLGRIPGAIASRLPRGTIRLQHRVQRLIMDGPQILAQGTSPDGAFSARATQVILALPPRLVAECLDFAPPLSARDQTRLKAVPTWMAGHGKAMLIYDSPFWRKAGLSGDAISHRGPLMEIHDASAEADPQHEAALFGFLHPKAMQPDLTDADLKTEILQQMGHLFGPEACRPKRLVIKRWAMDPMTATPADRNPLREHPSYGPLPLESLDWSGHLLLSGSETAAREGGYLEGALEAAEATLQALISATP